MEAPTLGGVAVAFVLLFVAFRLLELRLPREQRAPLWRDDLWTDIAYWAVTPFTAQYVVGTVVFGAVALLAVIVHGRFDAAQLMAGFGPLSRWPFWLQSLLMVVIADFVGYWTPPRLPRPPAVALPRRATTRRARWTGCHRCGRTRSTTCSRAWRPPCRCWRWALRRQPPPGSHRRWPCLPSCYTPAWIGTGARCAR